MNTKKISLLSLMAALLTFFLANSVTADAWTTTKSILDLSILKSLGISTTIDPLEGIIRFLLLILIFSLFYKGAELLKLGKNISIVIALVIALITIIFIPSEVIVAAATSYATVVSVILLAVPVGLCFFLFLIENAWMRLGLNAILFWVLIQMSGYIGTTASATQMPHWQPVLETIQGWTTFVCVVVGILLVVNLFKALASMGGSTEHHPNFLRRIFDRVQQKVPYAERNVQLKQARREETRLLNDLAAERDLYRDLSEASRLAGNYRRDFANIQAAGVPSKVFLEQFGVLLGELKESYEKVNKDQRRWKRAERREVSQMNRLVKELEEKDVSDKTINTLKADEKNILNSFIVIEQSIKRAEKSLQNIETSHKKVQDGCKRVYANLRNPMAPLDASNTGVPHLSSYLVGGRNVLADVPRALSALDTETGNYLALIRKATSEEKKAMDATAALTESVKKNWVLPLE